MEDSAGLVAELFHFFLEGLFELLVVVFCFDALIFAEGFVVLAYHVRAGELYADIRYESTVLTLGELVADDG